jgi:hypothetical protein
MTEVMKLATIMNVAGIRVKVSIYLKALASPIIDMFKF